MSAPRSPKRVPKKSPKLRFFDFLDSGLSFLWGLWGCPGPKDPAFPQKIPKNDPPARNSGTPRLQPQNTRKTPPQGEFLVFRMYFSGILGRVFSRGSRISGPGLFFAILGRVAGRGILNERFEDEMEHRQTLGPGVESGFESTLCRCSQNLS